MRMLDLRKQSVTVEELLNWASSDSVLILAQDGHEFILEEANDFEREVAMLGNSETFMKFLEERSKESGTIPLDEVERTLG
jgi:hypothetical protein